jgi:hypothetical protein
MGISGEHDGERQRETGDRGEREQEGEAAGVHHGTTDIGSLALGLEP